MNQDGDVMKDELQKAMKEKMMQIQGLEVKSPHNLYILIISSYNQLKRS